MFCWTTPKKFQLRKVETQINLTEGTVLQITTCYNFWQKHFVNVCIECKNIKNLVLHEIRPGPGWAPSKINSDPITWKEKKKDIKNTILHWQK